MFSLWHFLVVKTGKINITSRLDTLNRIPLLALWYGQFSHFHSWVKIFCFYFRSQCKTGSFWYVDASANRKVTCKRYVVEVGKPAHQDSFSRHHTVPMFTYDGNKKVAFFNLCKNYLKFGQQETMILRFMIACWSNSCKTEQCHHCVAIVCKHQDSVMPSSWPV